MKNRKITLYKDEILYDIDNLTYKFTDAALNEETGVTRNAVASDSKSDTTDHDILHRHMDVRDALLRKRLRFCLAKKEVLEVTNRPSDSIAYVYELVLPDNFPDESLEIVLPLMHDYMVKGSLFDWFRETGVSNQATDLDVIADELEEQISGMLRVPSSSRRPMQPFGPAE